MTGPSVPPPGLFGVPPALHAAALRAAVPDSGVGESFTVDLERAPQVIRDLTRARDELEDVRKDAIKLGRVDPGSHDDVSRDAAMLIGLAADGGPASLSAAVEAGVRRLDEMIAAIRGELAAYERADAESRRGFTDGRS